MSIINFPILYVPDPLKGRPLFSGQIFVGEPDTDPEIIINQKQLNIVQEDGTIVAVPQPFILSAGGVPIYNGSTVRLDVDGNYSLKILDRLGAQTYYIDNVYEGEPVLVGDLPALVDPIVEDLLINDLSQAYEFATVALMKASLVVFPAGKTISWGYYASGDDGSNSGVVKSGAHTEDLGSIFTLADGQYVEARDSGSRVPEQWGVVGNDGLAGVNNKTRWDAMALFIATNGGAVSLSAKGYYFTGEIDPTVNGQTNGIKWVGPGSLGCELIFSSYVSGQVSGIELGLNASNVHFEGFTVRGAGSGVLNDASATLNGLNDIATSNSPGFYAKDVAFRDWSGDGGVLNRWFQQRWIGCYGRDNGGWGIVSDGDQAPYFSSGGGQFFRENGTGGLWIKKGDAFVQDFNGENEDIAIKLGVDSDKRATLTMIGGNLERLNVNATGIYVSEFSQILDIKGGTVQGTETAASTSLYALYFEKLNGYNKLEDFTPTWFSGSNGDGFANSIYIAAAESSAVLEITVSRDNPVPVAAGTIPYVTGPSADKAKCVRANEFCDDPIEALAGVKSSKADRDIEVFWTQSIDGSTIDLRTTPADIVPIYIVNCDGGAVTLQLPDGADASTDNMNFKIMKIDNAFNLTLDTLGTQKVNGVDNPVLTTQYELYEIFKPSLGTNFFNLNV